MEKKLALITLINNSFLLTNEEKKKLIGKLKVMTPQAIDALGVFLATEKKQAIESFSKVDRNIDNVLNSISSKAIGGQDQQAEL